MLSRSLLLWVTRSWSFGDGWPSVEHDLELLHLRDKAAGPINITSSTGGGMLLGDMNS